MVKKKTPQRRLHRKKATTKTTSGGPPRQQRLPGDLEKTGIAEIEDAAAEYENWRDKRLANLKKEKVAKDQVDDVMRKHKKTIYRRRVGDTIMTVTARTTEKHDVQVKRSPVPKA